MKTITFNCPACSQKIETPRNMAGQSIVCPTCKSGFVSPSANKIPKWIPKTLSILGIIFIISLFVVEYFVYESRRELAKEGIILPANSKLLTPINGLFGIKLDAPLPKDCQVITSVDSKFITYVPPQTNAAFDDYDINFDDGGNVMSISARGYFPKLGSKDTYDSRIFEETAKVLVDTLTKTYGEPLRVHDSQFERTQYSWGGDYHSLSVAVWSGQNESIDILCENIQSTSRARDAADRKRRESIDTNGIVTK